MSESVPVSDDHMQESAAGPPTCCSSRLCTDSPKPPCSLHASDIRQSRMTVQSLWQQARPELEGTQSHSSRRLQRTQVQVKLAIHD